MSVSSMLLLFDANGAMELISSSVGFCVVSSADEKRCSRTGSRRLALCSKIFEEKSKNRTLRVNTGKHLQTG